MERDSRLSILGSRFAEIEEIACPFARFGASKIARSIEGLQGLALAFDVTALR
jgi:hypothetical protein